MKPEPTGPSTVTLSATAAAPLGTPFTPVTVKANVPPDAILATGTPPVPSRVSNSRTGATGLNRCGTPSTSTIATAPSLELSRSGTSLDTSASLRTVPPSGTSASTRTTIVTVSADGGSGFSGPAIVP